MATDATPSGPATPADSPLTMEQALASPLYRDLSQARLAPGDPAFVFELPTLDGASSVDLADYVGKRPVVLIFGSYT